MLFKNRIPLLLRGLFQEQTIANAIINRRLVAPDFWHCQLTCPEISGEYMTVVGWWNPQGFWFHPSSSKVEIPIVLV